MKKLITLFLSIVIVNSIAICQHGFVIDIMGSIDNIELQTATKTNVGTTPSDITASDFGPGGVLYAINSITNEFYSIDTTTGVTTILGINYPPTNHTWTGLAYDENTNIMYGYSFNDINDIDGTLYTIDITDGSYTIVGVQNYIPWICAIAIDNTGQIYGMDRGQGACGLLLISPIGGVSSTLPLIPNSYGYGMGYGMDYNKENETMYLTIYNNQNGESTLRTYDLTSGQSAIVGNIGNATGTIATAPILTANFSANVTELCLGETVNFTDESMYASSWLWTFEGGTPATSTDQNPTVTYSTNGGIFDVSLEVFAGSASNTQYLEDMITVNETPNQPLTPTGPIDACGYNSYTYVTSSVQWADTYVWEVLPSNAGAISGSDTSAVFEAAGDWTGSYTIKVVGYNDCGTGIWSSELNCVLNTGAEPFFVEGGGGYCEGTQGIEVTLAGSEINVDYELFLDDVSTGIVLPGTGNTLSFGNQTNEGIYSSLGFVSNCSTNMYGEAYVYLMYPPATGSQPMGSNEVCSGDMSDYQTTAIPEADDIIWLLSPSEAGVIIGSGEVVTIEWYVGYKGLAYLSVYGINSCGDGSISAELEINVSSTPEPVVEGETLVCRDYEYVYTTTENIGSLYSWEIEGGNITSGTGTSEILINWSTVGEGIVSVTETSAEECEGISETLDIIIDNCTGIGEIEKGRISVFPNPAKDNIHISFNANESITYELKIINQFGQTIYIKQNSLMKVHEINTVNVKNIPNGLYFAVITTNSNMVYQSKFVVKN